MTLRTPLFSASLMLFLCAVRPLAAQDESANTVEPESGQKSVASRFRDPDDGWFDASQWLFENIIGFMPVPIIITEPAVDNGLGVAGVFFHQPKSDQMRPEDGANLILPNLSVLALAYTGNDSWMVGGGH